MVELIHRMPSSWVAVKLTRDHIGAGAARANDDDNRHTVGRHKTETTPSLREREGTEEIRALERVFVQHAAPTASAHAHATGAARPGHSLREHTTKRQRCGEPEAGVGAGAGADWSINSSNWSFETWTLLSARNIRYWLGLGSRMGGRANISPIL